MSRIAKVCLSLVFLGWIATFGPRCAYACSCIPPRAPQVELADSAAVFSGKVTKIEAPGGAVISTADPESVTFQVSRVWKGPQQATLVIQTPRDSASCGFEFVEGGEYLVYARDVEGSLQTNLCSRTQQLAAANVDIAELGEGTAIAAPAPAPQDQPASLPETGQPEAGVTSRALTIGLVTVGGIALAGGLAVVLLRRPRRRGETNP